MLENELSNPLVYFQCPKCGRTTSAEYGWIKQHTEIESSAICESSGTYLAGWVIAD